MNVKTAILFSVLMAQFSGCGASAQSTAENSDLGQLTSPELKAKHDAIIEDYLSSNPIPDSWRESFSAGHRNREYQRSMGGDTLKGVTECKVEIHVADNWKRLVSEAEVADSKKMIIDQLAKIGIRNQPQSPLTLDIEFNVQIHANIPCYSNRIHLKEWVKINRGEKDEYLVDAITFRKNMYGIFGLGTPKPLTATANQLIEEFRKLYLEHKSYSVTK